MIINNTRYKTIAEGTDVKLGQKGSFRLTNLLTSMDKSGRSKNFDLTLANLSTDVKSLKEGSLSGLETSGTSRNNNIIRSNGTSLGGCTDLEGGNKITNFVKILVGENKTDVTIKVRKKVLNLRILVDVLTDSLTHHSLLTHKKNGLTTKNTTDLLHLVAANVVALDNDDLGILIKKVLELLEILSLPYNFLLGWHWEI